MEYLNDEMVSREVIDALLEVVNEDDLKSRKSKKRHSKEDIVKAFNDICKFMCGVEDISYEEFDKSSIGRYFCYYSIKTKKFEFLVNVELMNIVIEMMIHEEDCFLARNITDELSIDGAKVIFKTLLDELGFDDVTDFEDIDLKIKSDYGLKGDKSYYKFKIDDFNGLVCIKTKRKKQNKK